MRRSNSQTQSEGIISDVSCDCGLNLCSMNDGKIVFVEATANSGWDCFQVTQKLNVWTEATPERKHSKQPLLCQCETGNRRFGGECLEFDVCGLSRLRGINCRPAITQLVTLGSKDLVFHPDGSNVS